MLFAQFVQDVETAHIGQHHVEHDDVGPLSAGRRDSRRPVTGGGDVPALITQCHRHHLGKDSFIIDDEHIDRISVGTAHHDALDRSFGLSHSFQYPRPT